MKPDNHPPSDETKKQQESAANIVRGKLDKLYGSEPSASEEIAEVKSLPEAKLSKHQLYMKELSDSGKDLAEIQTAWHEYYQGLSNQEKHEVWQEFYSEHARVKDAKPEEPAVRPILKKEPEKPNPSTIHIPSKPIYGKTEHVRDTRQFKDVKQQLLGKIQNRAQANENHHIKSLAFGLTMGSLVVFILLFSFFNERFITPFIRPSHNVSATPIIVDPNASGPVGPESKIIIPKINIEAPVVYDVESIDEKAIQSGLERGVVHYTTTPDPGEKGNSVIVGHSSSNILNRGKFKFAFLLLKSLENDDTFIIQKDGKRYVYKIYKKFVTNPKDVSILGATDRPATMTLVTCDPPGTSTNRLIIVAEQIFPDPAKNTDSKNGASVKSSKVPGDAPTLWQRIRGAL